MASSPKPDPGLRFKPWVALALPPLAWYGYEIGLSSALRLSCATVGAWLGGAWGGGGLVVCLTAAWLAWRVAAPTEDAANEAPAPRPWLARIALVNAGLFALAILFQALATLIVPACVR